MIEIDVEIWTDGSENGTGTGATIDTVSQSATGIGIDGGIKNVRLVQIDETATATTTAVIANIVIVAFVNLTHTHTLFL
jgi:hypothetical protein